LAAPLINGTDATTIRLEVVHNTKRAGKSTSRHVEKVVTVGKAPRALIFSKQLCWAPLGAAAASEPRGARNTGQITRVRFPYE